MPKPPTRIEVDSKRVTPEFTRIYGKLASAALLAGGRQAETELPKWPVGTVVDGHRHVNCIPAQEKPCPGQKVGVCAVKDYYLILGLPRTATAAEIDAAFRQLARKYHPDLQPEEEDAVALFKSVTEAHEVLSNVEKRREYDRVHGRRQRRVAVDPGNQRSHSWREFEHLPQGWAKTSWTPAGSREAVSRGFLDIEAELRLMPEEAVQGGPVEARISVSEPCFTCKGYSSAGGGSCEVCGGQGTVWQSRLLQLRLPPRLRDGTVLRIAGHGKTAGPNSPSGDLCLRVRVRPCW